MSSTTHENTKTTKNERRSPNKTLVYGAAVIAALGIAGFKKVENASQDQRAKTAFEAVNIPHNAVSLDADTTVFGVASLAVEKGYLNMDAREASDFLTNELEQQMRADGRLAENQKLNLGAIQPGTQLEVPATWKGIGKAEPQIGTAATATRIGVAGPTLIQETDSSGNSSYKIEP